MKKLERIRHSASHVMAEAVKELFPKAKLGIGPAIEDGFYYDFDNIKISEDDLKKVEKKMKEIIEKGEKFKKIEFSRKKAEQMLKNEPYKLELLKELKGKITFYQNGNFIDLCKGPHVKSTKEIKAFKLLKIAGAYWKGNSKNKMLQRIYGTAFETEKELKEFLRIREEAEKRNHIRLGRELDLFSFHEEGPGFVFLHPKGIVLWDEIMKFWKEEHNKEGYVEIRTPIILSRKLWEQSGHWEHYKESMYSLKIDDEDYAVKPMNCPGGILWYKEKLHSYREFPMRVAEVGLVHRHELSGTLNGLFRVRSFYQDDAHIYCTEEQIKDEVIAIINLTERMYKAFGLKFKVELSTKPKKCIGTAKMWNTAEKALRDALKKIKMSYEVNIGGGAFYGPKIDFHIEDSLKRTWQTATIQLDFAMPEKFKLTYEGKDGKKHRPTMLHRTVYGGIERFIGILIEEYAGKFPSWISPTQAIIVTVTDRNVKYAKEVEERLRINGIRTEMDDRNESISKKVRDAQQAKPNYIITIGDKEVKAKKIAVRDRNNKISFGVSIDKFINGLIADAENKR